jgi:hypothetical protein
MHVRRGGMLSLVLSVVVVSAAQAKLPPPHPNLIVPGKSIGAVHLGMTFTQAQAAWDAAPGTCSVAGGLGSCRFTDNDQATTGIASFTSRHGRINSMVLHAPFDQRTDQYEPTGPLTKFHTSKKIHIGSRAAAVKRAYPTGKLAAFGGGLSIGRGAHETAFAYYKGKVVGISIGPVP